MSTVVYFGFGEGGACEAAQNLSLY